MTPAASGFARKVRSSRWTTAAECGSGCPGLATGVEPLGHHWRREASTGRAVASLPRRTRLTPRGRPTPPCGSLPVAVGRSRHPAPLDAHRGGGGSRRPVAVPFSWRRRLVRSPPQEGVGGPPRGWWRRPWRGCCVVAHPAPGWPLRRAGGDPRRPSPRPRPRSASGTGRAEAAAWIDQAGSVVRGQ